ncbi:unnamed protein product [Hyaloperonospora brassicae]|uniref:AAA+ ATPase domain-containing protein n=1 Tax=Hyaloperonospora brassicae TaxID=162125 RepID=A0AAV0UPT0_HYABA|nr:unnamed protein product [Hyaloperonospora brassicae]
MAIHGPGTATADFTCRCRVSRQLLRSRPSGAGQYALCDIGDGLFAVCRIALGAVDVKHPYQIDASVTIQRNLRSFCDLQPLLLVQSNDSSDSGTRPSNDLYYIASRAVRVAVAVTLELDALPMSKHQHSQLLRDADTRSLLQQTIQRNCVVCVDARVRLPTLDGLTTKQEELLMTFRVVSTYPAQSFVRITSGTRVTFTAPSGCNEVDAEKKEENASGDADKTHVGSRRNNEVVTIGGMEKERAALRELIVLPLAHPRLRSDLGVEFPKGVLLCGPPGVGKTLLVRSVVHECREMKDASGAMLDLNLQVINGSEFMTSGRGDAEQALRETFEKAMVHARNAQHCTSVIFIDEVDALCPKRQATGGWGSSAHSRIVAQLLTLLDGVESGLSRENVVVVAATNLPNSIDPALRRPGRFDREIFVPTPNAASRKEIFRVNLRQTPYALGSVSQGNAEKIRDIFLDTLAAKAIGYVGADIAALCREAAMIASTRQLVAVSQDRELEQWWEDWKRRAEPLSADKNSLTALGSVVAGRAWHANPAAIIPLWFLVKQLQHCDASKNVADDKQQALQSGFFSDLLGIEQTRTLVSSCHYRGKAKRAQRFELTMSDFDQAMQTIVPSALRSANGFMRGLERHGWESIGGQAKTKLALQQALEWPVKFPQTFARLGVKPPRGVLLYGPPGCSKSSIVRAAAHSSGATFLSLSAAQVFSPFFGDAEAAVRQVFRDARAALPAIVFFDEIDVMVAKRDFDGSTDGEGTSSSAMRVLSTMLNEMDGVESPEGLLVIGATNRPACIDAALMRPGRFDRILFVDLPTEPDRVDILRIHSRPMQLHDDVDMIDLANRTPYFSGAELENLCREAALLALRESLEAKNVRMCHFNQALCDIIPVSSKESMRDYIDFAEAMGHLP